MRLEPPAAQAVVAPADVQDAHPDAPGSVTAPAAVSPNTPLSSPKPKIPDAVCQQRLSGWVGLEFAILPDGTVKDVRVTASEPQGAFDAAAVEAVSGRAYAARPLPVKMREKMFLSFADCRSEQLRASADAADASAPFKDCPAIATAARAVAAPFDPAESGRAVLAGGAQAYSAPDAGCPIAGKRLKAGTPLVGRMEYKEFSLVGNSKDEVWVKSNQLKDTSP